MGMSKGGTAAIGVNGFIPVPCSASLTDVFPAFTVRKISGNLCGYEMGCDDEIIGIEQVQVIS